MENDIRNSRRIWVLVLGLLVAGVGVTVRLAYYQVVRSDVVKAEASFVWEDEVTIQPPRGFIYDRHGNVLAAPGNDYRVTVAPPFVYDARALATELAPILLEPRTDLQKAIEQDLAYVVLNSRVSAELAAEIEALDDTAITLEPLQRRIYPQGELLCHALGYVDFDNHGGSGLEGYYQSELAGLAAYDVSANNPAALRRYQSAVGGTDLVLTVDATIQRTVEEFLQRALREHRAEGGTILAMDPRTGAILAMASTPCYDPTVFYDTPFENFVNPAISLQYEPGSVMKLITMAAAVDSGTVAPNTTYVDNGVYVVGPSQIFNSDFSAPGVTDMTTLLRKSYNVGSATIAGWMGPDLFYNYLDRFGFGQQSGIDLVNESAGTVLQPGHPLWTPVDLATNSFGQGLAVTPLQMLSAVSAIANGGRQMRPYLVAEFHTPDGVIIREPEVMSIPISEQAANQVANMAVQAGTPGGVPGFTVAGKTGTAQIPEGGVYHPTDTIGSFVGWLPADDPQLIMLVKLDRPQSSEWGSRTAAPTFAELAQELVILLDIPPDDIRLGTTAITSGN